MPAHYELPHIPFTYEEYDSSINSIIDQILENGAQYDLIVALMRGGALGAVAISSALNDVPVKTIQYGLFSKPSDPLLKSEMAKALRVLVVDDILDSGETMKSFLEEYGVCDVACLIWNTEQPVVPTYYGKKIQRSVTSAWFDFFWNMPGRQGK